MANRPPQSKTRVNWNMERDFQRVNTSKYIRPGDSRLESKEDKQDEDQDKAVHSHKNLSNPQYSGPGIWFIIHKRSFEARTREQQLAFIELMHFIRDFFPCKVCQGHCSKYVAANPLEPYVGVKEAGEDLGMFLWTWKFHNAVNSRLGKNIVDWKTAYSTFNTPNKGLKEDCHQVCEAAATLPPTKSKTKTTKKAIVEYL